MVIVTGNFQLVTDIISTLSTISPEPTLVTSSVWGCGIACVLHEHCGGFIFKSTSVRPLRTLNLSITTEVIRIHCGFKMLYWIFFPLKIKQNLDLKMYYQYSIKIGKQYIHEDTAAIIYIDMQVKNTFFTFPIIIFTTSNSLVIYSQDFNDLLVQQIFCSWY